jgi:site-specific DNA recombinase
MAVGIYLRVSTEEQRERQSIVTQRDLAEGFCRQNGLPIHAIYADDGVSGTIPLGRRPEGGRLLRDARLRKFDQLVVYKLDRIGRDPRFTLEALAQLEECGVGIRSLTESLDHTTSSGKLMTGLLSCFAGFERDQIRERSMAGTNRVAQAGAWLGGIVPYGYRKEGEKGKALLVVSEEPIPNLGFSEAEIVRTIYRMSAIEHKSCFVIAEHLNRIGAPCAYTRDGRQITRGKRKTHTSGLWRPGRVRNLLVNSTYMGRHEYGKRSKNPNRELIVRPVQPIVTEDIWQKARKTLTANVLFSKRNSSHQYLLRGVMKCGLCGLTYIGFANRRPSGKEEFYYRCNGKHGTRGLYGANGQRCPSKDVNGSFLEQAVWGDVEGFLRNPGAVIEQLQQRIAVERRDSHRSRERLTKLEGALAAKTEERDRILALFRKGVINENDLGRQLNQISQEEAALRANIDDVTATLRGVTDGAAQLQSAQELLEKLRDRLDAGVSWEVKRQLVEALVGGVRIDTCEEDGKRRASIAVTYRFAGSIATCTDTRADSNWSLERVYRPPNRWAA